MSGALGRDRAEELLAGSAGRRVVVLGDVFLDRYLVGRAERLSREGPVPVLAHRRGFEVPGGAANPARNLATLGMEVVQVAVVGADAEADALRRALAEAGIDAGALVVDPDRCTTLKTRVVAEGLSVPQQVARIDRQSRSPVDGPVLDRLVATLREAVRGADALLVSHYRSGVVVPETCEVARAGARASGALLTVDAQGDLEWFGGFDLVRVGRQDAGHRFADRLGAQADPGPALSQLRADLSAGAIVLGRGSEGMSLADDRGHVWVRPANVSEVYDVAGAGDTVIAVMTAGLVAGADVREAALLASIAAGIVVRRLGVAAPTVAEIGAEIERLGRA